MSEPMEILIVDAHSPRLGRKRWAAAARVRKTGLARFNRNGTDLLDTLAKEQGLPAGGYNVKLGANEQYRFVGLYPVDLATPGAVAIRRNKRHGFVTVYLHELFAKVEDLRPERTGTHLACVGQDSKGRTCVLVGL